MMLFSATPNLTPKHQKLLPFLSLAFKSSSVPETDEITKLINDHPFPTQPLLPILSKHIPLSSLTTHLVETILGRLFSAHTNGLKALEFFRYALKNPNFTPTPDSFDKTLHILVRMRYFDNAWEFLKEIRGIFPHLVTVKSMSIMLCKIAKFGTYEETLEAFERMKDEIFMKREFGTEDFNVLLRAFVTQREMKEARSVFLKMHSRFEPDAKTMNVLLLGFKESGDVTAMELFYHEMVKRGFKANAVTYNIRIDGYCKKRCFGDALRLFEEMGRVGCVPTLETITTLIHGAGVARNLMKARQLFDEVDKRKLRLDIGTYNALISAFVKCRDVSSAMELMNEMEEKGIGHDNITYHTLFLGMMKSRGLHGVCELYERMKEREFVPKTRTVVMLMKFFCQNGRVDLGLEFWRYMLEKGYCPHGHALELLVTGLCSRGRVREAFECSRQTVERGRVLSEAVYLMLERGSTQNWGTRELEELKRMMKKLQSVLPPSPMLPAL